MRPNAVRSRALFSAALALTSWLGAGCLVGPDYAPPPAPALAAWHAALTDGLAAEPTDETLASWWTALGDPLLVELETRAAAANLDLAVAAARVNEARAQRKAARAGLFPSAAGRGGASRSRIGRNPAGDNFDVGFDASWEIDLFGGLRRGVEAARAELAGSVASQHGVRVSVAAEVALAYVDFRALQRRLALAEANAGAQAETLEIAGWRSEAGLTTQLDVEQARASLAQTRAAIPQLRQSLSAAQSRLAVLLGEPPGALDAQLAQPAPVPLPPERIAVGVPAEALARRPDVAAAERALAAETARIGVAKADALPKISLTGSLGVESATAASLFTAGAQTSQLVGGLTQVLFDFGRVKARVEAQQAVRDRALAQFEQTLLSALEEAENALVAYAQEQQRRAALADAAASAERAATLARAQYTSGLVDFQSVLVAERTLFSSQDELAASEGACSSNLVRLYKALGGGFESGATP